MADNDSTTNPPELDVQILNRVMNKWDKPPNTHGQFPASDFLYVHELSVRWGCDISQIFKIVVAEELWAHPREWRQLVEFVERERLGKSDPRDVNRDWLVPMAEVLHFEQTHGIGQSAPNETKPQIIEESAKPAPAQDAWIARARALYRELKRENPRLNQNQLAKKIAPTLTSEGYLGRGNKPFTAENIARRALQNM